MSTLAISYTFSPTTTIESGQMNQNFTDIVDYVNNTASPVGLVALWKGSIASIPTGWAIDTDLRDKMAIGAGNLYAYAATGGEATHTLTLAEIPAVADKDHTHTFTTGVPSGDLAYLNAGDENVPTNGDAHTHSGTTSDVSAEAGGGGAHNNLPPYYALAYIRRT